MTLTCSVEMFVACPICKKADLDCTSEPNFSYCKDCHLVMQNRPAADPLKIYDYESYDKKRMLGDEQVSVWSRFHHDYAVAQKRIAQIHNHMHKPPARWVDYGCGNGAFLAALNDLGYVVSGVEPDPAFCKQIKSLLGIEVVTPQEWFAHSHCHIISFLDVIEHLIWPVGTMRKCLSSVSADGRVLIEVPDLGSPDLERHLHLAEFKHHRPDEHLFHFSYQALERMREMYFHEYKLISRLEPIKDKLQIIWQKKR